MSKTPTISPASVGSAVKSMRQAQQEMASGIEALRAAIASAKAERARLMAIPVASDLARKRVAAWVEERVNATFAGMVHDPNAGRWQQPLLPQDFTAAPQDWRPKESLLSMIVGFYLKDHLVEAICKQVQALYQPDFETITETDRESRLSKLDRDLLDAEMAEESIIRAAERAGYRISRRGDLDPRAFLADDEELP